MISSGFSDPEAVSGSSTSLMSKKVIHPIAKGVIFCATGNEAKKKTGNCEDNRSFCVECGVIFG